VRRFVQLALAVTLLTTLCSAADLAHLRNGFTIRHDRREVIGDKTRLYTAGGFVEVPTAEIVDYEHDDTPEPAAAATPVKTIPDHVAEASKSTGIDPDFLNSVIHHESGFNPHAVSKKGARGLMQLMPDTADKLGVRDSFDPGQNIQGGAAYLRQLLELYHGDAQKALAAYNAGPHRVQRYNGVPPYTETRAYVAGIIREYNRKKIAEQKTVKAQKATDTRKPVPSSKTVAKKSPISKPTS
jgi:soluble lytic murein transglycosylase-like protein